MDRTLILNDQDIQVLDQMFQAVLRVADVKSAKVLLALHTKIDAQLQPAAPQVSEAQPT